MAAKSRSRVALVTGATRGIGEHVARRLAKEGFRVVVGGRDEALGKRVAKGLRQAAFRALDVAREEDIASAAAWIVAEYGGLDVLVNNAGIALDGFDEPIARRTLDVNFWGTVRLTDALLPHLRDGARIVMVSSGLGELSELGSELRAAFSDDALDRARLGALVERFVTEVGAGTHQESRWPSSAYAVSKIAMNSYVRVLARELASDPRKILVNAACPGWVKTNMGGSSAPRTPDAGAKTPAWLALLPEGGPTGGFFRDERRIGW